MLFAVVLDALASNLLKLDFGFYITSVSLIIII